MGRPRIFVQRGLHDQRRRVQARHSCRLESSFVHAGSPASGCASRLYGPQHELSVRARQHGIPAERGLRAHPAGTFDVRVVADAFDDERFSAVVDAVVIEVPGRIGQRVFRRCRHESSPLISCLLYRENLLRLPLHLHGAIAWLESQHDERLAHHPVVPAAVGQHSHAQHIDGIDVGANIEPVGVHLRSPLCKAPRARTAGIRSPSR